MNAQATIHAIDRGTGDHLCGSPSGVGTDAFEKCGAVHITGREVPGCWVINAGEKLEWDEDQVVHAECAAQAEAEVKARPTCPNCWQVLSVSGACGCEPS